MSWRSSQYEKDGPVAWRQGSAREGLEEQVIC